MLVNAFIDQEFVDLHKLFVADKRLNKERMTWEYYIKSRKAVHYKEMVADSLYHPPSVNIHVDEDNTLINNHIFEGTLLGLEYMWGDKVSMYTMEPEPVKAPPGGGPPPGEETSHREIRWKRFRYTMKDRKMSRTLVD